MLSGFGSSGFYTNGYNANSYYGDANSIPDSCNPGSLEDNLDNNGWNIQIDSQIAY
jgi:hypothetical protein